MNNINIINRIGVSILICVVQIPVAQAQLDEIIVTAQKREQNLQDVPMAITAIGRELLENNEIRDIQDLTKLVPSMRFTPGDDPTNSSIRIRGVGTDIFSAAVEPNVSVVIDNIPLARTEMASFEFSDLERVEILRGPQGTLFGKNSTAGLIHVITRDPSPEFEAFMRLNYEQPHNYPGSKSKFEAGVSGPILPSLGYRITGFAKKSEGHLEDVLQNENSPNSDSFGLRSKIVWDPRDEVNIKFSFDYQRLDGDSTPVVFRSANPQKEERSSDIQYGKYNRQTKTFGTNRSDSVNRGASLTIDWLVGNHTLTSITGLRDYELVRDSTLPALDGNQVDVTRNGGDRKITTFTQEIRLSSSNDEPLEYTIGALWWDNSLRNNFERQVDNIPLSLVASEFGADVPVAIESLLDTFPQATLNQYTNTPGKVSTNNLGIFAQATWYLTHRWRLTAGARYIYEKLEASILREESTNIDITGSSISDSRVNIPNTSIKDNAATGSVSLQYDLSERSMAYGSASTGYRGGTFDLASSDPEDAFNNPVDPEKVTSFELGMKSRLFDNRLELNIAIFRSVFKDFQTQIVDLGDDDSSIIISSGQLRLDNAGELITQGLEIDFQAQPLQNLSIFGSVLYNDAKFTDFITQCFVGQQPGERGGIDNTGDGNCDTQDVSGGTLPNAPKWSASINARYEHNLQHFGQLAFIQIGGRWVDDVQHSAEQHPLTIQEGHSIWDMRLGWTGLQNRLDVSAYVNNIFQKKYVNGFMPLSLVNDRRDIIHLIPMESDRSFGLTIAYNF